MGPMVAFEEEKHAKGSLYRLILRKQDVADSGKVNFSAVGNQCHQEAYMEVKDLPLGFTKELNDQEHTENTPEINFECHTTRQTASAKWLIDGRPISDGEKFGIVSRKFIRKLIIRDLNLKDNYVVKCRVSDGDESAETSALLKTGENFKSRLLLAKNMLYMNLLYFQLLKQFE